MPYFIMILVLKECVHPLCNSLHTAMLYSNRNAIKHLSAAILLTSRRFDDSDKKSMSKSMSITSRRHDNLDKSKKVC